MSVRLLLLLVCLAALAGATPLTLTLVGIGDGTLGNVTFVDQTFTFTFTTDTTDLVTPPSEPTDQSTPSGTAATFMVNGITATLDAGPTGEQAIFEHPSPEDRLGIWQENLEDWLTVTDPAFASYSLVTPISLSLPANEVAVLDANENDAMPTNAGNLFITSIEQGSTLTFTSALGPPTNQTNAAPEPSTFWFLCLGSAGLLLGLIRRRRRA